jgi:hypothetical protein
MPSAARSHQRAVILRERVCAASDPFTRELQVLEAEGERLCRDVGEVGRKSLADQCLSRRTAGAL